MLWAISGAPGEVARSRAVRHGWALTPGEFIVRGGPIAVGTRVAADGVSLRAETPQEKADREAAELPRIPAVIDKPTSAAGVRPALEALIDELKAQGVIG